VGSILKVQWRPIRFVGAAALQQGFQLGEAIEKASEDKNEVTHEDIGGVGVAVILRIGEEDIEVPQNDRHQVDLCKKRVHNGRCVFHTG